MINGLTGLSLMLLDVLSGIPTLKVCIAYQLDNQMLKTIPSRITDFERVKPIYKELPGWSEDISHVKSYEELPINAKKYIQLIEEITGIPVVIVSVGADASKTIVRKEMI